ncbi:MAG: preprotein translocase YidC, partial [Clostridia bacterium]|nr:preprotein translocase YidC [Clostridia bacterium]
IFFRLLITDWSGIAAEFSFATERPSLFINTKPKISNPEWEKVGITPIEMTLRKIIGVDVEKQDLDKIGETVEELFNKQDEYKVKIQEYYKDFTFNHGNAAEKGAQYILKSLSQKNKNKN